jgi:hypothetical protein
MNKVAKAQPRLNGPDKPNPVIACPACGASIPIADALGQALAEQAAEAAQANINWKQQERKLKSELAKAVRARETELAEVHNQELISLRKEQEKAVQTIASRNKTMLERVKAQTDAHMCDLRDQMGRAEALGQKLYQEGRAQGQSEAKRAQQALLDASTEAARLKQDLAAAQARLSTVQFDQQAAFEKGRTTAAQTSQKQLAEMQKMLDEVRTLGLKREKELDVKLALAIREAEERGTASRAREKKVAVDQALQIERERLLAEVSRERAVERQRFETQATRMKAEIDALHQRAEVGVSEATGQAAEDVLERELREAFQADGDILTRARKGQKAADLTLAVTRAGSSKLLIESKWTQTWDHGWIPKAREDRATAGAEAVIIVSRALPTGVEHLRQIEDVWIASPKTALVLITALRQGLVAVERAKRASTMDEARVRELKTYLSGPQFREQVETMVTMAQQLLDGQTRERTQHERAWKEARAAFDRILGSALGIWTGLEIASGQSLQASEVLQPYLKVPNVNLKPRKRQQAA